MCIGLVHARTGTGKDQDEVAGIAVLEYDTHSQSDPPAYAVGTNRVHHRGHALLGGGPG